MVAKNKSTFQGVCLRVSKKIMMGSVSLLADYLEVVTSYDLDVVMTDCSVFGFK